MWQASAEVSWAAVAAFLCLLLGRQIPASTALCAQMVLVGSMSAMPIRKADVITARASGIKTILTFRCGHHHTTVAD